jgi:hypothetical protein
MPICLRLDPTDGIDPPVHSKIYDLKDRSATKFKKMRKCYDKRRMSRWKEGGNSWGVPIPSLFVFRLRVHTVRVSLSGFKVEM